MRAALRTSRVMIETSYAMMIEYRSEIFLWCLAGVMPFILMGLWAQASASGAFGIDELGFVRYFFAVFLVRQLTVVWVVHEFEMEVVQGHLSSRLLQPIDPVWRHAAAHVAERFARAPLLLVLIVLFFVLYPKAFWVPGWREAALFLLATLASLFLRFIMQYCEAMLAFWTERAAAISQLSFLVQMALSGSIAPLEVYPPLVRELAMLTPFPYLIYFPARLLVGPADAMGPVWRGFVVMAVWFVAMLLLNRVLWRVGIKRYSGMGA